MRKISAGAPCTGAEAGGSVMNSRGSLAVLLIVATISQIFHCTSWLPAGMALSPDNQSIMSALSAAA
jgi:hypothetical protein